MRLSVVTFVTLLVLSKSLYAAPIGENAVICSFYPNENDSSGAFTTEAVAPPCTNKDLDKSDDEPILTRTEKQHSPDNISFQCHWENCNQSFDSVTGLSKHVEQSHFIKRQKYYKCKWKNCNYGCYKISNLQKHLRKHTKERPFVCQYDGCGLSFTQKCNLKQHIKTFHLSRVKRISALEQECESLVLNNGKDQQQAVLRCDWKNCNRNFDNVIELTNHITMRHIVKWHSRDECQWKDCNYSTSLKNNMIYHIRKHTKERPFICSYNNCGKSFSHRGNLHRHIEDIHLFKTYLLCPLLECNKKYSSIDVIRGHFYVHTAASNLSISDVDSIWNAFRKNVPYPAEISNRIKLKEQRYIEENKQESNIATIENESNQKTETSTNGNPGNIDNLDSNEFSFSNANLDLIFSEVTAVVESVPNVKVLSDQDKDNKEAAANDVTECISFTELDKDGSDYTKRPLEFDNKFDYASDKRIKSTYVIDNSLYFDATCCLEQNDHSMSHQNLQSLLSPLASPITTLDLFHSISNELLEAQYFIEQYLEFQ